MTAVDALLPGVLEDFVNYSGGLDGLLKLIEQAGGGELAMAIMGLPPEDLDFVAKPFLDDPLVVIAHPDHPLVQEREIPLLRLAQESFLMRESDSAIRKSAETLFANAGVEILPSMVINSTEAIKQSVRVGLGLAVVPLHSVTLEIEKKCLAILDVVMMPLHRSWYLVHRQGKRFSSVADSFKDFVIEEAQHTIESNITADGSSSAGVQNTAPCVDSERVSRRRR